MDLLIGLVGPSIQSEPELYLSASQNRVGETGQSRPITPQVDSESPQHLFLVQKSYIYGTHEVGLCSIKI